MRAVASLLRRRNIGAALRTFDGLASTLPGHNLVPAAFWTATLSKQRVSDAEEKAAHCPYLTSSDRRRWLPPIRFVEHDPPFATWNGEDCSTRKRYRYGSTRNTVRIREPTGCFHVREGSETHAARMAQRKAQNRER